MSRKRASKKKLEKKRYSEKREKPLTREEFEGLVKKAAQPVMKPEPKGS